MLSAAYGKPFYEAGYAVVIYDQRAFGQSGGSLCTIGERERYDLLEIIKWVRTKLGDDVFIGLHGESMGGITVLEAVGLDQRNIGFVVADSAPSDVMTFLGVSVPGFFHLPRQPAEFLIRRLISLTGPRLALVSPRAHLDQVNLPVLFLHGDKDAQVPVEASQELYALAKGRPWRLEIFPGADHCWGYLIDPERYERILREFIASAEARYQKQEVSL
jgi:fermentation-respiration switch protein FrsA (DUF1100 family)